MTPRRVALLVLGCVVLGTGVALLLTADLGADGYSTLVHGVSLASGLPFWLANVLTGIVFLTLAATRGLFPGVGTAVQVVVVGITASLLLDALTTPQGWVLQASMLGLAIVVLATGVAAYLGSQTGAGPAEAAGLAWDPPVPFRWSYSLVQAGGSLLGWLLGATVGPGTVLVILLLGPAVDGISRVLRVDVHQPASRRSVRKAA